MTCTIHDWKHITIMHLNEYDSNGSMQEAEISKCKYQCTGCGRYKLDYSQLFDNKKALEQMSDIIDLNLFKEGA